uniref:Alpha/beta hydrolase fold-3 domain-containing protein n=1 Tax=Strix occidentalis caurina TaxID=311401 RepID=A0A8D0EZD0_STROC
MGSSPAVLSLQGLREGKGLTTPTYPAGSNCPRVFLPTPCYRGFSLRPTQAALKRLQPAELPRTRPGRALTNCPSSMPMTAEPSASWYTSLRRQAGRASMVLLRGGEGTQRARAGAQTSLHVPYGAGEGERLDIYYPTEPSGTFPALVYIHGGYWQCLSPSPLPDGPWGLETRRR